MLTNNIISFEQLGPDLYIVITLSIGMGKLSKQCTSRSDAAECGI